jgi:hypothetical protein
MDTFLDIATSIVLVSTEIVLIITAIVLLQIIFYGYRR